MGILKIIKQDSGNYATISVIANYLMKNDRHDGLETYNFTGYNIKDVVESFKFTQEHFNKYKKGRQYIHMVIGFDDKDNEILDNELIFKVTKDFLSHEKFKNHESFSVIHRDTDNVHAHLVINAVNFVNGKKYKQDYDELYEYKKYLNSVFEKYNLTTLDIPHHDKNNMNFHYNEDNEVFNMKGYESIKTLNHSTQFRIDLKKQDSWTERIAIVIQEIRNKNITNFSDFKKELSEYNIDLNYNNKYLVFTDLTINSNTNKIRDKRLNKLYNLNISKEILMEEFENNEKDKHRFTQKDRKYSTSDEIDRGIESNLQDSYTSEFIDNLQNINTSRNDNYNANDVSRQEQYGEIDKFINESKYRARERERERNRKLDETNKRIREESDKKERHNQSERERLDNDKIRDILNQFSEEYEREEKRRAENERRKADEERRRAEYERRELEQQRENFEKQLGNIQQQERVSNEIYSKARREKRGFDFEM